MPPAYPSSGLNPKQTQKQPQGELAPKLVRDRIDVLDILRGLAILLIFLFNIPDMGNTAYGGFTDPRLLGWTHADRICWSFLNIFLEGTQRGLLQFLFGAGALILLEKTMPPEGPVKVADLYFRRNLWLFMFGLFDIYALLWFGDILFSYALAALFLFPFRRLAGKTLLILGLVYVGVVTAQGAVGYRHQIVAQTQAAVVLEKQAHGERLDPVDEKVLEARKKRLAPFSPQMFAEERAAHLGSLSRYSAWSYSFFSEVMSTEAIPWIPRTIRNFFFLVLGMAFFKFGITQGRRSTQFYRWLCLCCYAPGLLLRAISVWQEMTAPESANIRAFMNEPARLAVTIGHIALINLAIRTSVGRRLLAPFKAVGRTAFSLYLMQSVLGMLVLFPAFGFGLWGRYGWFGLTIIACIVMAGQLVLANVWLRYFAIGPMEWAWRSLSYQRLQPFRRRTGEPRAVVV